MTAASTRFKPLNQKHFWKSGRDQYLVDPAYRDSATGKLGYPVPAKQANAWVIVREICDDADPHELPTPCLIAECEDQQTAVMLLELIEATRNAA